MINLFISRGRRETDYTLILQQEGNTQWFLPDQWIFRHLPPPPPYMSPAGSLQAINPNALHVVNCIDSDSSDDDEDDSRSRIRSSIIIMNRQHSNLPTNI